MNRKLSTFLIPVSICVAIVAFILIFYHTAVNVIFRNLTVPVYHLEETEWDGGTSYMNVPYSDISSSDYVNIYVPHSDSPCPLFVLIHGGGFINGDAEGRQPILMYRFFRDHGFACATVNYRLAGEAPFPAAIEDCKAAIRFLRAHASEYGYDASRIAVFGESAGGYLAVMCAVTNDDEFNDLPFNGQESIGDVSARVDVLVDYYGAVEKNIQKDLPALGIPGIVYKIANHWADGEVTQGYENVESFWHRKNISEMTASEIAACDPYTYIEENVRAEGGLSAWIVHGSCDLTIPYLQSVRLHERLSDLLGENRTALRIVPGMGHASDPLFSEEELTRQEIFLKEHLGIEP